MKKLCDVVRLIAARAGIDATRANDTFCTCIEPLTQSQWPEVAWRFSRLTADGCPVEVTFSSACPGLRYTVEAGGPEMPEAQRIDAACATLRRLGHRTPPDALIRTWRAMQTGWPLRWGCWLGIRHRREVESAKLYVEVPRGASDCLMVMTSYEIATGRVENYFRRKPMGVGDLRWLNSAAVSGLERLWGMPIHTALGFFSPGYSISGDQVAFFVRAGWIGGAAAARRRLIERESGGALNGYRDLLGDLTDKQLPDHGVLTLGFDPLKGEELRVGLSGAALASLR